MIGWCPLKKGSLSETECHYDGYCSSCPDNPDREYSVCDDCAIGDEWECKFCCDKCYEDYGECPNPDCDLMDI